MLFFSDCYLHFYMIHRLESLEYNECDFNSYQEYESKLKSKSKSIDTFKDSLRQYEYYLSTKK